VILGRNGSGKSTLLLHCNGILRPQRGQIYVDGDCVAYDRASIQTLRRKVGIVFQSADDQLFSASVAQDISFGPLNLGLAVAEVARRVAAAAALCDITNLLDRPTHALSTGQKMRVALAGVLAMEPTLLIGDEVLSSLDAWMRLGILAIFDKLVADGKTVLLSTHDLDIARHWADLTIVMDAGRVVAVDTPSAVFASARLRPCLGPDQPWSAAQ